MSAEEIRSPAPWLHRLAVSSVCLIWPLIWVGGLVTTYDAGMAVPDWPGTYGYNLFLYPIGTWLAGPFDLFIEHGHRLLGAVVGMVAIAMVVSARRSEPRVWVSVLAVGLLLAVISQGVLGGMRVVLSDRTLAMIHGCVGPAVFAYATLVAVTTSRFWYHQPASENPVIPGRWLIAGLVVLLLISYGQLVLGAQLRHVQPNAPPSRFALLVACHIMAAGGLWLLAVGFWWPLRRCGDLTLSRPGLVLIGLVSLQILLGVGTWVVSYGVPSLLNWIPGSSGFLIHSKGFLDSIVVTAHVATGSLILAVATFLLVRTLRRRGQILESSSAVAKQASANSNPLPQPT